jgi:hypothetical protein
MAIKALDRDLRLTDAKRLCGTAQVVFGWMDILLRWAQPRADKSTRADAGNVWLAIGKGMKGLH